jgi:hypothetical protein
MSPEREARLEGLRKLEELAELAYSIIQQSLSDDISLSNGEHAFVETVVAHLNVLAHKGRHPNSLEPFINALAFKRRGLTPSIEREEQSEPSGSRAATPVAQPVLKRRRE